MAEKVLVIGPSGTGKSHSMKTLLPQTTVIIDVDQQGGLPFKGWKKNYSRALENYTPTRSYDDIKKVLLDVSAKKPLVNMVIIDTIYYVIMQEYMNKAKIKGFDKYVDMGLHFWDLFNLIDTLREDLTVVIMAHSDMTDFNVREFAVPGGKLVKEKVKPQGLARIVLETAVSYIDGKPKFQFLTQHAGDGLAKSPEGMFPDALIENDLNMVRKAIVAYDMDDLPEPPAKVKTKEELLPGAVPA